MLWSTATYTVDNGKIVICYEYQRHGKPKFDIEIYSNRDYWLNGRTSVINVNILYSVANSCFDRTNQENDLQLWK